MARGGSKSLAIALQTAAANAGGEFLLQAEPEQIIVESGKAVGVQLADGRTIRAKHGVVSSLNPHQTFVDLLSPNSLSGEWRAKAEQFEYNLIAPLFGLNLNLCEAPVYKAAEKYPQLNDALMIGMEDGVVADMLAVGAAEADLPEDFPQDTTPSVPMS